MRAYGYLFYSYLHFKTSYEQSAGDVEDVVEEKYGVEHEETRGQGKTVSKWNKTRCTVCNLPDLQL